MNSPYKPKKERTLKNKTLFITGASRGIGLAVAKRAAIDGANIAIASKTTKPHPKLPGTIHTAAEEITRAGGNALAIEMDLRDDQAVKNAIEKTAHHFGGIDILVNNASAIAIGGLKEVPIRKEVRYQKTESDVRKEVRYQKICLISKAKSDIRKEARYLKRCPI